MDRILPYFATHPSAWTVFIPWAWTKTDKLIGSFCQSFVAILRTLNFNLERNQLHTWSKSKSHSCMNPKVWTMKTFNPSLENLFQWATVLLVEPFLPFVFCTWCLNLKKSGVEYLLLQTVYKRTILPVLYYLWIQYKTSKTSFVECCLEFFVLFYCFSCLVCYQNQLWYQLQHLAFVTTSETLIWLLMYLHIFFVFRVPTRKWLSPLWHWTLWIQTIFCILNTNFNFNFNFYFLILIRNMRSLY